MIELIGSQHEFKKDLFEKVNLAYDRVLQNKEIGFLRLHEKDNLWSSCNELGKEFSKKYTFIALVGIGGSSLGVRVISEAFNKKNIYFFDNVDAVETEQLLSEIDLEKCCWIFASKSGSTVETLATIELVSQLYKEKSLSLSGRSVIISEVKESALTIWGKKLKLPVLEVPTDVGGRYSVLSPIGMFPAAYMNLNLNEFKLGAKKALESKELVCKLATETLMSFDRSEWITVLWPYTSLLKSFGLWYQQLWAESLGKKNQRDGKPAPRTSTPIVAVGATDQHSVLQMIMDGYKDKFIIFIRNERAESGTVIISDPIFNETKLLKSKTIGKLLKAEAMATEEALRKSNISAVSLQTKVLSECSLGYLFMYFQLVVATLGEVLNINAYDQPGVELGKRLAKEKLNHM